MNSAGQRVREAAVHLFAVKGFHGTGIRDLAEAAQLSSASLYHYMGTKEGLLVSIMVESLERLLDVARRLVVESATPTEALARLVQLHVVTHAMLPEQTMVVDNEIRALSAAARPRVLQLRDEYEQLWRSVIEAGAGSGAFVVAHPSVARLGLLELCTGVAHWFSPGGPLTISEVAQAHVDMAFAMLGAGADARAVPPPVGPILDVVVSGWGLPVS